MAAPGYVATILNGLPQDLRAPLNTIFEYVMREFSLGANTKAENFAWFKIEGTTASVANTEFSVEHGLDHIPSKLIPMLPLDVVNAQNPTLIVSRVADARRVYLKSAAVSAFFQAWLE